MTAEVRVEAAGEMPEGSTRVVSIAGVTLALVRAGGVFYALDNRCPHSGGPLGEGTVEVDGTLRCPWHERHFDPKSGVCTDHPATRSIACFPARVDGNDVLVTMPAPVG